MFEAKCIYNDLEILVSAEEINNGIITPSLVNRFSCPQCGRIAFFVNETSNVRAHFRAVHDINCPLIDDKSKHKRELIIEEDSFARLGELLNHKDKPFLDQAENLDSNDNEKIVFHYGREIDDDDRYEQLAHRNYEQLSTIYRYLINNGLDSPICDGIPGRSLFISANIAHDIRHKQRNMTGIHIVATRRLYTKALNHLEEIIPAGYLCLVEANSEITNDTIIIFVKLAEASQHKFFKEKIISSKEKKFIILLADWEKYENSYYPNVYINNSDISTYSYTFTNTLMT